MSFTYKFNPLSKKFDIVQDTTLLTLKGVVATTADLPLSGNTKNDLYVVSDGDRLYTWNKSTPTGILSDWVDVGTVSSIDWSIINNKPTSSVVNIDDAVTKKHTHTNSTELDKVSDGDHDVRIDNPHSVEADQVATDDLGETVQDKIDDADAHIADTANPHSVDKTDVGLGNVPNLDTTDAVNNEHTQGTDTTLGSMSADIDMNSKELDIVGGIGIGVAADANAYQKISDKYIICKVFTAAGINACIDALGAEGGEVYLPEGTYVCTNEAITIDYNNTTLTGAGKGTILDWSAGQNGFLDTNDKDYITIQNISFLGNTGGGDTKSFIGDGDDADYLTVKNCWFLNSDTSGIVTSGTYQKIINNIFNVADGSGYGNGSGAFCLIDGNTFISTVGVAVNVSGSGTMTITNNDFISCSVEAIDSRGLHSIIDTNRVTSCGRGIEAQGNYLVVSNNTINDTGTGQFDIKVLGGDYSIITGNTCYGDGTSDKGIWLDEADYCVVTGNISSGHDVAGIQEDSDCEGNLIYGNNCQDSTPYIINGTAHKAFRTEGGLIGGTDAITSASEGVAASLTTLTTDITTDGDADLNEVTLANGIVGQIKYFAIAVVGNVGGSLKITPDTMVGGTQITFAANPIGLGCIMKYTATGWVVVGNNGGTIA